MLNFKLKIPFLYKLQSLLFNMRKYISLWCQKENVFISKRTMAPLNKPRIIKTSLSLDIFLNIELTVCCVKF